MVRGGKRKDGNRGSAKTFVYREREERYRRTAALTARMEEFVRYVDEAIGQAHRSLEALRAARN